MTFRAAEAVRSVYGAARMAQFDARGIAAFDGSREAALRSFWVAAILMPLWALTTAVLWSSIDAPIDPVRFVAVQSLFYVISWTAFPVILALIAFAMMRGHHFFLLVSVYNWSHIVQTLIVLPILFLTYSGALPDRFMSIVTLGYFGFIVIYEGFIIRICLKTGWTEGIGLAVLDIALAFMLQNIGERMVFTF